MPLVKANCTNCGATLEVDNAKEAAICPYCNTAYIVEKAINHYNTTVNISDLVVKIYNDVESETTKVQKLLKKAETHINFKDYDRVWSCLLQAVEKYPEDCNAWLALLRYCIFENRRRNQLCVGFNGYDLKDIFDRICITADSESIVQTATNEWTSYWHTVYESLSSHSLRYCLNDRSCILTSNGLKYYGYAGFPSHTSEMSAELGNLFKKAQDKADLFMNAGVRYGFLNQPRNTGWLGWWPMHLRTNYNGREPFLIHGPYAFFQKGSNASDDTQVGAMFDFGTPLEATPELIDYAKHQAASNVRKLTHCPRCNGPFKMNLFGGRRTCKYCGSEI